MLSILFAAATVLCLIYITCRLARALIRHWFGLLQIPLFLFCMILSKGRDDGVSIGIMIVILANLINFVRKKVKKSMERREQHMQKSSLS